MIEPRTVAAPSRSRVGGIAVRASLIVLGVLAVATTIVLANTLSVRYERDVTRMVFNDNLELLRSVRLRAGLQHDSLAGLLTATPPPPSPVGHPYLVISIEEHRLWYREGDSVLFTAAVATGSGKVLERDGDDMHWRFETPRGRLAVVAKDSAPIWVAPDWHYVETAQRRGLGVVRLERGKEIPTGDGGAFAVVGTDVVKRDVAGRVTPVPQGEGNEAVAGGNILIPPHGTRQRKYLGILGSHRLALGDGYAIHGTNSPESIGHSVSHGCVRLLNSDIAILYAMVPVGTPVFIY